MTYDLRKLYRFKHLRHICALLVGALVSVQVSAALVYVPANQRALQRALAKDTGAGTQKIEFGGSSGAAVIDTGSATLSTNGGNALQVSRSLGLRNPSGNSVPVVVEAAAAAASFIPIVRGGLMVASILGTGVALYDFANELGFHVTKDSAGALDVKKVDTSICTVAPCYAFKLRDSQPSYEPNAQLACTNGVAWRNAQTSPPFSYTGGTLTGSASVPVCNYQQLYNGSVQFNLADQLLRTTIAPAPTNVTNSSLADLENAIASKSGWPSNSKLPNAVAQSLDLTGTTLETGTPTVTGPSTSTGTTTTVTNVDNSTKTTTTTHNHTYSGPNVSTSTVTVTNNYNPATNTTTTETKTETPAKPEEVQTDCDKYPDSNGCREDEFDTPEGDIPKTTRTITLEEINLGFGGGSCPADMYSSVGGQSVKVWDWAGTCTQVTTYVKPLLLSLAAVSALLIVFMGGKPE